MGGGLTLETPSVGTGAEFVADGGMHHQLAASGNLGQVIKRDYPIVAATRLGADVVNLDLHSSSRVKGETVLDTIYTLQAMMVDVFVMRDSEPGLPAFVTAHMATAAQTASFLVLLRLLHAILPADPALATNAPSRVRPSGEKPPP